MKPDTRAQALVDGGHVKQIDTEAGLWEVDSTSKPNETYQVFFRGAGGRCECKGFQYRGWCVHLKAVSIVYKANSESKVVLEELD